MSTPELNVAKHPAEAKFANYIAKQCTCGLKDFFRIFCLTLLVDRTWYSDRHRLAQLSSKRMAAGIAENTLPTNRGTYLRRTRDLGPRAFDKAHPPVSRYMFLEEFSIYFSTLTRQKTNMDLVGFTTLRHTRLPESFPSAVSDLW